MLRTARQRILEAEGVPGALLALEGVRSEQRAPRKRPLRVCRGRLRLRRGLRFFFFFRRRFRRARSAVHVQMMILLPRVAPASRVAVPRHRFRHASRVAPRAPEEVQQPGVRAPEQQREESEFQKSHTRRVHARRRLLYS